MQKHIPVLLKEVLYFLRPRTGSRIIDSTVGGGGHTEATLANGAEVLGIDQDPTAVEFVRKRFNARPNVFKVVHGNFSHLYEIASTEGFDKVDGILFDLGFSSFQIDDPKYGLSFNTEAPLDMRLDPKLGVTAADLVNSLPDNELYKLFKEVGEEKFARSISRAISQRRSVEPFKTTKDLAEVVEEVYGGHWGGEGWRRKIHPATRVFMALRIAVNSEFENLKSALPQAVGLLGHGGRLVVISFHSGEDRIVKNFFKEPERMGVLKILTKKPVVPDAIEIKDNPRARSSKLRAAEVI